MTKFISVKVFRGTIPEGEKYGQFGGMPGACFRVATEDDNHVKCFHVFVFASLMLNPFPDVEMELVGAEVVAEYKITPAENGDSKIERIK